MAKAQQKKCVDGSVCGTKAAPAWLTTFGDLMALLLTFFVLLLSFSSTNKEEFQNAIGALQGALGVLDGEPILTSPVKLNVPIVRGDITEARPTTADASTQEGQFRTAIGHERNQDREPAVEVVQSAGGIRIRIRDSMLFDTGRAEVKPAFRPLLKRIGDVLCCIPNEVVVEGHTDDVPIHTEQFPSNYWLSSARALKVMEAMMGDAHVPGERLVAVGYGQYRPLASNDTPEGRASNRRVEIEVLYDRERPADASVEAVRQMLEKAGIEEAAR